ncbi:MAG TPA: crotonase/enoyl-CoA hydratase family protein [Nocardioidaceae bacterium]|nr:crotonase/enoyl-CoA hydratase family protein [Nocardioidaceae bacterium]
MPTRHNISWELADGVAYVRLDRPEKYNGLTLDMLNELTRLSAWLRTQPDLRAVVLSGAGDSFCSGLDFASTLRQPQKIVTTFLPRPWRGTNNFQEACWGWRRLPVPVIAIVHGHVYGGGLQLAMAADFRFTTPDSQWSVLETKWGLIPDMTGIRTLSEQVGMDQAKLLTMTGDVITGTEAHRIGLATSVSADPHAEAGQLVDKLLTRSPDAVAAAKRLFTSTWTAGVRKTFHRERIEQLILLSLRNTAAARNAAFKKETPRFHARLLK